MNPHIGLVHGSADRRLRWRARWQNRCEVEGEIMILESMKMEIPVLSPKAGTIKEIRVNEGEAIGEGQLVAILDA